MPPDPQYRFGGFKEPRYTPIPDEFFDEVAPNLTEAELRVALYVLRRTFGFKKQSDAISLSQMSDGITTRGGRVLDRGTGMSRSAVWRGSKGLVEKGILVVSRKLSPDGDNEANVYQLRFAEEGVVLQQNYPLSPKELGVILQENPQETVRQQTEKQEFEISKNTQRFLQYDEGRMALLPFVQDLSRELNDQAPLSSTTTRVVNIYRASGLDLDAFIARMLQARAVTQERTASIRTTSTGIGSKPKIQYWFAVLEDLASSGLPATGTGDG